MVKEFERVTGVPVTLDVFGGEICGIAGEDDKASYLLQLLLLQIITNHGYDDVKIVFLAKESNLPQRQWIRFTPHIWSDDYKSRYLLCGKVMAHRVLNELYDKIKEREVLNDENNGVVINARPHYVFIVEDSQLLENEAITKYLYNPSKQYGVSAVFLASNKAYLPSNCKKIVSVLGKVCEISDKETGEKSVFTPDAVNLAELDMVARRLASIRIKNSAANFALPNSITLNETYSIKRVEELDLLKAWEQNKTYKGMRVQIGARAGNELFYLDMHEKGHGPHGLVAGTTGSGKSELLQSIIISLAINYHPHDVAFVLIDYKGGGMADVFQNMPHLAGTITNLGGNQTVRALISIKSEIRRRQMIFSEHGVNNIDKYQKLYHNNMAEQPVPHLIIIADEFAELKAEQPEFMKELVSAARVGRSLGIHLILATQKPAGVVDDQIWSNSKFKICLKVQDAADSKDVIKRPDASLIKEPGRAYIQVGNDEIFEMFQSSYSGAEYAPDKEAQKQNDKKDIYKLSLDGKQEKIYPLYIEQDDKASVKSQLEVMVDYINKTAKQAGIEGVDGLWLPPLEEEITLSEVINPGSIIDFETGKYNKPTFVPEVGIVDDPAGQEQKSLAFDFVRDCNLFVYGMSGSGKTVFLKSLCLSLALTHSPDDVNIYIMDMGGTAFKRMEEIPHIGDVMGIEDEEKINQFIHFMIRNIETRKNAFIDAKVDNFEAYVKQGKGEKLPAIIIMIDNYYALSESYELIDDKMMMLAREGNKHGIYLVATATTSSLIRYRFSINFKMAVTFALTDKGEYSSIVGRCGMLEPQDNPGRGLVKETAPLEFQAADARLANMQLDDIVVAFEQLKSKGLLNDAPKVPQMPDIVDIFAINRNIDTSCINIGLKDKDMKAATADVYNNHVMLVAGAVQSGKSTIAASIAMLLLSGGAKVYAKDSSGMGIYPILSKTGVTDLDECDEQEFITEIEAELQRRREMLIDARKNGKSIEKVTEEWQQIVFVFDDIIEAVEVMSMRMKDLLARIAKKENGMKMCIIAAGNTDDLYSNFDMTLKPFKEAQHGILLGSLKEQSLFNVRMNYSDYEKEMEHCDGYMISKGKYASIRAAIDKALL
ncbi:MAG: type VII secretion protein EssC [Clostridia bacterium]|nr:type VII secretion protein EssC [Clostridia bacterium]